MAAIPTPVQAKKIDDLTTAQFNLIRQSLGINDDPLIPEKTYIIFDAISGNNNLHLDIGASSTYSIIKGDGTVFTQYTDTGGIKILNYVNAGRYLITIEGVFYGLDTDGAIQADKDKYISIIAGTNYPTSIINLAFKNCVNLESVNFPLVTSIGDSAFENCSKLKIISMPAVTTIGVSSFAFCAKLESVNFPLLTTTGDSSFRDCNLKNVTLKSLITLANNTFYQNYNLEAIIIPAVETIGSVVFQHDACLRYIELTYSATLLANIGVSAFSVVAISDLRVNSATFTEASNLLVAMRVALLELTSDFRLLYGNVAQDEITVDLGDWDMATNAQITVPFPVGVTFTNCYDARVYIIDDTSAQKLNFEGDFQFNNAPDGQISILASGIQLNRLNTGRFIGGSYDLTPFNRGHCTIRYKR